MMRPSAAGCRKTNHRHLHHEKKKRKHLASSATKVAAGIVGSAGLLLAAQALYVAASTPRLPPPANSGHDFEEDGLVADANFYDEGDDGAKAKAKGKEFNLVLLGDSPVEGIGNETHCTAMGGRTALAFSEKLKRPVRYWSYGKSGLTAEGIEMEMVPLLQRVATKFRIDAVIISCGVNNVLSGHSAAKFGYEVDSLLTSVEACCSCSTHTNTNTRIILLQLIDFEFLPFLPWPLSKFCSWRSRELQKEMGRLVNSRQVQNPWIEIASFPDISALLSDTSHHLLDYMVQEEKERLALSDFYSDDNFHPASHGTIVLGKILARTYTDRLDATLPE